MKQKRTNKNKEKYTQETNQNYNKQEQEKNLQEKGIIDRPIHIGTRFSDFYEVISGAQAEGGMGKAILCKRIRDDIYCVLKKAQIKNTTEAFKREIEFTLKLDKHPNIVYTQTAIKEENTLYMVMELVGKQQKHPIRQDWWFAKTLKDVIENKEIDLETAFTWSIEFCRGMQYLNSVGLKSHQDIKPANIFITEDRHIKIADFGLASFEGIFYSGGTKKYFSPEHNKEEKNCDIRSDIYSFGIVMYEMFNAKIIENSNENTGKYVYKKIEENKNKYCNDIIKKCLQEEPNDRYQTFVDLEEDLIKEAKKEIGNNFKIKEIPIEKMEAEDYSGKAFGYQNINKYEQAIKGYDRAIKLDSKYVRAYDNRGFVKCILKEYEQAINDFNKVIELNPRDVFAYYTRGVAKVNLRQYEQAIKDFDIAITFHPKYAYAVYNARGVIKKNLKQYKDAIRDYDKSIELYPKNIDAYNNRGLAKFILKQYEQAIKDYNKVIEFAPKHPNAYNGITYCYLYTKQTEKAFESIKKALEIEPKNENYIDTLGDIYKYIKKYDKAIEQYRKAIEINNKHISSYNNLVEVYKIIGKEKEAKETEEQLQKIKEEKNIK